jgi:2-amino-4-hydroxy-6-hydroxymethyldihydropteridine diphosphokinase
VGSSLGDRRAHLATALAGLRDTAGLRLRRASPIYETAPVGGVAERRFLNAVLELTVTPALARDPEAVLARLHGIEARAGRSRSQRWEDRTLDLDLVLWGARVIDTPTLVVPHPELARRRFVLQPLADLVPDAPVPSSGLTVSHLLEALPDDPADAVTLAPEALYPEPWPRAEPAPEG